MTNKLTSGYFKWRCRRGMKELDVMLNRYIDIDFDQLTDAQCQQFDELLNCQDTDLWYWLMGKTMPEKKSFRLLIENIRAANNSV